MNASRLPAFWRFGVSVGACAVSALFAFTALPACTVFDNEVIVVELPDAGSDARPINPPETFLSLAEGAKVCSRVAECPELAPSITITCGVPIDSVNFSVCMSWVTGSIPSNRTGIPGQRAVLGCFAAADSCLAAGSCLGWEILAPGDARCPDGSPAERCSDDGSSVIFCGNGNRVMHCSSLAWGPGSSCVAGFEGLLWCAVGPTCNVLSTCHGNVNEYCLGDAQLPVEIDCAISGNECGIDPLEGFADCLAEGRAQYCGGTGSACDADGRVTVCNGYVQSLYDCPDMGATCVQELGPPLCVRPGEACTPFDPDVNVCTGTTVKLCVGGEKIDFDCASIGKTCMGTGCR